MCHGLEARPVSGLIEDPLSARSRRRLQFWTFLRVSADHRPIDTGSTTCATPTQAKPVNLAQKQLDEARGNANTKLPKG
jgi:hypothetical protein